MVANALIVGLITYTLSIVYNLIAQKSLETVFFIGVRFLFTVSLTVFFLQLAYYLIKNFNKEENEEEIASETENEDNKEQQEESESEAEQGEAENTDFQNSGESAIENDFDNQDFSAFSPEDFDLEQNSNQ